MLIGHLETQYGASLIAHFPAFLAIAVVVIVTPGPDTALTVRNALFGGRRAGIFTAVGVACGQATWAVATSAGLAALLRAFEPAFVALKLAGSAYLIWLGAQALFAFVRAGGAHGRGRRPAGGSLRAALALRQGLLSNLGNPKMAVFFTSLLPQFVAAGRASFLGLLLLGIVFCALTLGWLSGYAVAVAKAGDVFLRPRIRRLLDAVTGVVLVALGVRLAAERG